jgi:hypothetical protein
MRAPSILPAMKCRLLAWGLLTVVGSLVGAPDRYLFLDPAFVREAEGATLVVNPPRSSEIVIRADKPWETFMITFYLMVIDDGGKLRMWYICRDQEKKGNVAYAESVDGVHWTKSDLGVLEYHGSRANNLGGQIGGGRPDEWEAQKNRMVARLGAWADTLKSAGAVAAVGSHPGATINTPDKLLWLLRQVARPEIYNHIHYAVEGFPIEQTLPALFRIPASFTCRMRRANRRRRITCCPGTRKVRLISRAISANSTGSVTADHWSSISTASFPPRRATIPFRSQNNASSEWTPRCVPHATDE